METTQDEQRNGSFETSLDPKKFQELEELYKEAQAKDKQTFSEMRSYILLKAGEHYGKKWVQHYLRSRRSDIPEDTRIRLTKNEIQKIIKLYVGNMISAAPGAAVTANNEKETQDQKAAELHQAVLSDIKVKHKLPMKLIGYADDFVTIGECICEVGWDWDMGTYKRDEPITDEMGLPQGTKTVFSGALTFDRMFGPDVFFPAEEKDIDSCPWVGTQKMVAVKTLKKKYKDSPEKLRMVEPSMNNTFVVFEQSSAQYNTKRNQALVKKITYKPCVQYPKGYFFMFTEHGVLEEGELPFGIWPFVIATCEEVQTSKRGVSPVKHWKSYQVELNRMASKIAEHQITLGDDKIIIPSGAKLASAGVAPGIRAYSSAGTAPTVIAGRSGDQYLPHAQATREELYSIALVAEELQDKTPGQIDPYSLLLQSSKWKKKFSVNISKFENFVVELYTKALEVTRAYIEEDELIYMVGRSEQVNLSEFKNSNTLCYQIKLEPQADDIETRLGKKLSIDRYLQYAGTNLTKEDVGKFIRLDPYLNKEELLSDFTLNYDNAINMILAIDRGQPPVLSIDDDIPYMLKKLVSRQRQADYQYVSPQVKDLYEQTKQGFQALQAQQQQQIQQANAALIPATGMAVTVDLYQPDPKDPSRQVRARLPYDALSWLIKQLDVQGQSQESLQMQSQNQIAQIMQQAQMQGQNQAPQQGQQPLPSMPQNIQM